MKTMELPTGPVAASALPKTSPASLDGLNGSVPVPPANAGFWRQMIAFAGPAFLISVGYMDPGNWATDLQAGAQYRYGLLWVVGLSSLMAIVMQVLAARLGLATGKDLAQACRDYYPRWTRWPNWLACEIAIGACDLAEVLGSAVAINLLFHIPLFWAVLITAFDVLLLLSLQGMGMRVIEAVVVILVATIGVCYFLEIFVLPQTQPNFLEMGAALLTPGFRQSGMIVVAIGIIGATVMPHNLYLHSALVQSRKLQSLKPMVRRAIRFNTIDTLTALTIAFFVNAAILVLAAMVFNGSTGFGDNTDWIRVGYHTLARMMPTTAACTLFAVALLASGQSSTITGTMAGQVVMEGFMHWRIQPWVRRLLTRMLAIVPAVLIIGLRGETSSVTDLLTLSQVVLAMQLPLAMIPLMHFTSSRRYMGKHANGWFLLIAGWGTCLLITALDLFGLPASLQAAWAVVVGR
jgi:manganese transport protein